VLLAARRDVVRDLARSLILRTLLDEFLLEERGEGTLLDLLLRMVAALPAPWTFLRRSVWLEESFTGAALGLAAFGAALVFAAFGAAALVLAAFGAAFFLGVFAVSFAEAFVGVADASFFAVFFTAIAANP
jgi:hypothetical protein